MNNLCIDNLVNIYEFIGYKCFGRKISKKWNKAFFEYNKRYNPNKLLSHQHLHFERIINIFKENTSCIDTSSMGSGKNFTACSVAKYLKYDIIVICPIILLEKWKSTAKYYNINIKIITSYNSLKSFLSGFFILINKKYKLTTTIKQIKNCMYIFDEFHNLKNISSLQHKLAHKLVKHIIKTEHDTNNKILLLSATPCDKINHIESILKLIGYVQSEKLTNRRQFTGFYELLTKLNLDKNLYQCANKQLIYEESYELYIQYIQPKIMCNMQLPIINYKIYDNFCDISKDQKSMYKMYIKLLKCEYESKQQDKTTIFHILKELEHIKSILLIPKINKILDNTNKKIIIFGNYIKSMNNLNEHITKSKIINGSISKIERQLIIKKFQESNNDIRCLIINTLIGCSGIDLHDTNGNFPRLTYIIPNYNAINILQCYGRTNRSGVKSKSEIKILYGKLKDIECERKLLQSLYHKINIISDISSNMFVEHETIFN